LKELPPVEGHLHVRDLPDFHIRWLEFRPEAIEILAKKALDEREQEILLWLIRMADRIGASDVKA
jgi:hypothetical protein